VVDLPTLQRRPGGIGDDAALTSGSRSNPRALSNALAAAPSRAAAHPLSALAVAMLKALGSQEIARSPTGLATATITVDGVETHGKAVFASDIAFRRSAPRIEDGVAQELNDVTVASDASTVYGRDAARRVQIREAGTTFLRVDPDTAAGCTASPCPCRAAAARFVSPQAMCGPTGTRRFGRCTSSS
jgi:hypothetical protein